MSASRFLLRLMLPTASALLLGELSVAPAQPSAAFQQHYEAAVRLFLSERYQDALKEFEAAYSARQWPRLLINIGTTHRKLGEAKAALTAYEAYLRIEPNPEPEVKKKLDESLSQVRALLELESGSGKTGGKTGGKPAGGRDKRFGKPSLSLVDTGIDRLRPDANNKPSLETITASGEKELWAAGSFGTLLHYDGKSWSDGYGAWRSDLKQLSGTGATDVWAAGTSGGILHFDGHDWFKVPSGTTKTVRGVFMAGGGAGGLPAEVFAVDEQGALLRFDGTTWLELPQSSTEQTPVAALYTGRQGNVWAVGPSGTLLRFDGKTLSSVLSGTTKTLSGVWSNGPNDTWVVGAEATILHSTGKSFAPVPAGIPPSRPAREALGGGNYTPTNNLYAVFSAGPGAVFAAGGAEGPNEGFILRYNGKSFVPVVPATKGMVLGLWGSGPRDVWAVGTAGLLMHFDGKDFANVPRQTENDLRAVWGTGPSDVWAAGSAGTLLHYDGKAWSNAFTRSDYAISRVYASGEKDIWAVGSGPVRHFDGTAWRSMNSGSRESLSSVFSTAANNAWFVGAGGTIMHYDGQSFTKSSSGTTQNLLDVWGSEAKDVYAVGEHGTLLHYDGNTWSAVKPGTAGIDSGVDLKGIYGTGSQDVWVIGGKTLLHYDGKSWKPTKYGKQPRFLYGIGGSSAKEVCISADSGVVLYFNGKSWTELKNDTGKPMSGVLGLKPGDFFLVGDDAVVLHLQSPLKS